MPKLKKGDIVKVYQDPISKKKLEGTARLLKCSIYIRSYWQVEFLKDNFVTWRFVNSQNIIKED